MINRDAIYPYRRELLIIRRLNLIMKEAIDRIFKSYASRKSTAIEINTSRDSSACFLRVDGTSVNVYCNRSSNKISLFLVMSAGGSLYDAFFTSRARSIESAGEKKEGEKKEKKRETAKRQVDAQVREISVISSTPFERIAPRLFFFNQSRGSWSTAFTSFRKQILNIIAFARLLLLRKSRDVIISDPMMDEYPVQFARNS